MAAKAHFAYWLFKDAKTSLKNAKLKVLNCTWANKCAENHSKAFVMKPGTNAQNYNLKIGCIKINPEP